MLEKWIDKIVESGKSADMVELKEMFEKMMEHFEACEPLLWLNMSMRLHELACGSSIGEDTARCWVSQMENNDGTKGEHWNISQVEQVIRERGIKFDKWDFYTALNMVYSDYYNAKFDTLNYIELAKNWLDDKDIAGNKLLKYYYFVVKNKE